MSKCFCHFNGYEVKDSKARPYNTVSEMKSNTNLVSGNIIRTIGYHSANDGGGATYLIRDKKTSDIEDLGSIHFIGDSLVAELIIENNRIIPEYFGAYGDGDHDDIEPLNKCITYIKNKRVKLEGNKKYLISSTLNIVADELKIELNELKYTGSENAIKLTGSNNIIKINKITSNGKGVLLEPTTEILINGNKLEIIMLICENNALELIARDWGILDNIINFRYIKSTSNYGIYCYCDHNEESSRNSYIGENAFYGGRIDSGDYGVYVKSIGDSPAVKSEITGMKFYNINIEGTPNGFYFDNTNYCVVDYPRYQEYVVKDGVILKLVKNTRNLVFNGTSSIAKSQIDYSELTSSEYTSTKINAPLQLVNGGYVNGKCGRINKKGFFFEPYIDYLQSTYSGDKDLRNEEILPRYMRITGEANIILSEQYSIYGITDFYVSTPNNNGVVNIYASDGTTVLKTISSGASKTMHLGFNQEGYLIILGYSVN